MVWNNKCESIIVNTENKRWPAPAKLNLFLHVTGKRDDGYHTLQTVFQFVDWCDWLTFEINQTGKITRTGDLKLDAAEDLCLRAASLLQKTSNSRLGASIHLDKQLPIGGGLGGGSSDAATTLLALNELWGLKYSKSELATLGLQLGADVPVFIQGQAAFAEGVGELLTVVEIDTPWYVILLPQVTVSTAEIFADPQLTCNTPAITIRDLYGSLSAAKNDLQPVARKRYPEVDTAIQWLAQFGQASMTGSGACVFLAVENKGRAEEIAASCPGNMACQVAKGMNKHPIH
jgi:4-diphosphocytidyl-2-C-methyl-D-erythritol kinase